MTDQRKEAAEILRGLADRVTQLEQAVSSSEGRPNLVRSVEEDATAADTVSVTTEAAGAAVYDQDNYDNAKYQ